MSDTPNSSQNPKTSEGQRLQLESTSDSVSTSHSKTSRVMEDKFAKPHSAPAAMIADADGFLIPTARTHLALMAEMSDARASAVQKESAKLRLQRLNATSQAPETKRRRLDADYYDMTEPKSMPEFLGFTESVVREVVSDIVHEIASDSKSLACCLESDAANASCFHRRIIRAQYVTGRIWNQPGRARELPVPWSIDSCYAAINSVDLADKLNPKSVENTAVPSPLADSPITGSLRSTKACGSTEHEQDSEEEIDTPDQFENNNTQSGMQQAPVAAATRTLCSIRETPDFFSLMSSFFDFSGIPDASQEPSQNKQSTESRNNEEERALAEPSSPIRNQNEQQTLSSTITQQQEPQATTSSTSHKKMDQKPCSSYTMRRYYQQIGAKTEEDCAPSSVSHTQSMLQSTLNTQYEKLDNLNEGEFERESSERKVILENEATTSSGTFSESSSKTVVPRIHQRCPRKMIRMDDPPTEPEAASSGEEEERVQEGALPQVEVQPVVRRQFITGKPIALFYQLREEELRAEAEKRKNRRKKQPRRQRKVAAKRVAPVERMEETKESSSDSSSVVFGEDLSQRARVSSSEEKSVDLIVPPKSDRAERLKIRRENGLDWDTYKAMKASMKGIEKKEGEGQGSQKKAERRSKKRAFISSDSSSSDEEGTRKIGKDRKPIRGLNRRTTNLDIEGTAKIPQLRDFKKDEEQYENATVGAEQALFPTPTQQSCAVTQVRRWTPAKKSASQIMLEMQEAELNTALRRFPEADASNLKKLDVTVYQRLVNVRDTSTPNMERLITRELLALGKSPKIGVVESILSNYHFYVDCAEVDRAFNEEWTRMLEGRKIRKCKERGSRGVLLFKIVKANVTTEAEAFEESPENSD